MQGLLHKIEEKAQASGLMKHQQAGTTTGQPTGDVTTTTATGKPGLSSQLSQLAQNPQIAQLNHQMRSFQHHYVTGSSSPVLKGLQIGITAHKGVALDYDTLSRDTALLGREMDGWVKSLPVGDTVTHEGVKEGPVVAASGGLYEAEPTLTLLNLTTQLSSIQKILSTRLLDSRTHLKSLREIEQGINEKQIRLKELEKRHAKNESLAGEVEKLRYEIKESSYGLGEKRGDGFKKSEKAVWEAYTEYAKNLLVISHAGETLCDLMPSTTPVQTATTTSSLSAGEKKERVRNVEEGVRRSLAGLPGGWSVEIHEADGRGVGRTASRSSFSQTQTHSSIPPHVIHTQPVQADIIGAYPSSHLNNDPTPLPTQSSRSGDLVGTHKHHSSFDRPVSAVPLTIPNTGSGVGAGVASHGSFSGNEESALRTDSPPTGLASEELVNHPTMAETGVPVLSTGGGPSSGQFERKSPSTSEGIVRLDSLGGEGIAHRPSQSHMQEYGKEELPSYGEGYAARASAFPSTNTAGMTGQQGDFPPPPQHPDLVQGKPSGYEGLSPREQAEMQLRQKGYQG